MKLALSSGESEETIRQKLIEEMGDEEMGKKLFDINLGKPVIQDKIQKILKDSGLL